MTNFIININHIPGQNNGFQLSVSSKAFTIFFFFCQRESFVSGIFPSSPNRKRSTYNISAGFKKQSVFRAITVSTNCLLTFSQKRENRQCYFFLNKGDIPLSTQNLKINIDQICILETHELVLFCLQSHKPKRQFYLSFISW